MFQKLMRKLFPKKKKTAEDYVNFYLAEVKRLTEEHDEKMRNWEMVKLKPIQFPLNLDSVADAHESHGNGD